MGLAMSQAKNRMPEERGVRAIVILLAHFQGLNRVQGMVSTKRREGFSSRRVSSMKLAELGLRVSVAGRSSVRRLPCRGGDRRFRVRLGLAELQPTVDKVVHGSGPAHPFALGFLHWKEYAT